jgi:hypothetical protein
MYNTVQVSIIIDHPQVVIHEYMYVITEWIQLLQFDCIINKDFISKLESDVNTYSYELYMLHVEMKESVMIETRSGLY